VALIHKIEENEELDLAWKIKKLTHLRQAAGEWYSSQ